VEKMTGKLSTIFKQKGINKAVGDVLNKKMVGPITPPIK
jgi:hypothetical protein